MDAEAYSEASRNVLQILWEVASSRHTGHGSLWAKARTSAFEALIHYEVNFVNVWSYCLSLKFSPCMGLHFSFIYLFFYFFFSCWVGEMHCTILWPLLLIG